MYITEAIETIHLNAIETDIIKTAIKILNEIHKETNNEDLTDKIEQVIDSLDELLDEEELWKFEMEENNKTELSLKFSL